MFGTILAALDGSPKSEAALGTAIDEAKAWKASLHAVYVIETGLHSSIPWTIPGGHLRLLESQGKEALKAAEAKAAAAGVSLTAISPRGMRGARS